MAFRLTIGVCLVQVTVDSMNLTEPGESVHVGRAFGSRQTWRLRRSALIRHWTTRLNVITTGGWRFIRLHAAGKPTAAFKRSEVEPLSASKFEVSRKNKRYSDYCHWESKNRDRERKREGVARGGERGRRLLSPLQVNISLFQTLSLWDHELIGRCWKLPQGISQRWQGNSRSFLLHSLKTHTHSVFVFLARKG